jgi:hypothetical protein
VTYPTKISPWFVVARLQQLDGGLEYCTPTEVSTDTLIYTPKKHQAQLFLNLNTAARIRDGDPGSMILVLCSLEDLREYRP